MTINGVGPTTTRPGGPRAHLVLWTCLAANVLIVESLFFLGPSGKNELLSIARFVGLHAALLTMLQLVLVARIPYLDRRLGMDRLTLWHRWNGFGLLWLVVTHGLLVVLGYAALDGAPAARTLMALAGVPASLLGMLATAVIVLVAVTSVRWMRKRLPYELWHAVHILLYVALVLALLHQALETTTLAGPLPGAYWWAMWVAVGTALVYGRVVVPLWRNLRHGFRVAAVVPEAGNAVSVYVTGRRLDRLPARAGQFAIWRFFEHNFWWTANPFSLSAMPDGRTLRLTAKAVGRTSAGLRQLPVGTRVFIEGPYGAFTGAAKVRRDTLLVAGGVGITPVRALLEELGGSVTVLYRVRSEAEASLLGEVRNLARSRGARLHLLAGPTAPPISAALIANLVPDVAGRDVFVCGPPGMNMLVLKALRQLGVPRSQVHWERFGLG